VDDDSDFDQEDDGIVFNCIRHTPSTPLFVVRCAFSQSAEKGDWRRTTIFDTITKIGGKNCKMIMDSESCINAVSSKVIKEVRVKVVPHPHICKVSWINSTALDMK